MFAPLVNQRGDRGYSYAELFLAPGPQVIGQTGDNSYPTLFGRPWAATIRAGTRIVEAWQGAEAGGGWTRIESGLPPLFGEALPEGARRLSLAFDQAARAITAYELDGHVFLTRWSVSQNAYLQNVDFPGHDPVVVMDATWAFDIPSSDVIVFYLSPDRLTLHARVQRDNYSIVYDLHEYDQPVVLDRVQALPFRYQVLASDANGEPLTDSGGRWALVSDLYPAFGHDAMSIAATPLDGSYEEIVIREDIGPELLALTATPLDGAYEEVVKYESVGPEELSVSATPMGGTYELAVLREDAGTEELSLTAAPLDGAYDLIVLRPTVEPESLSIAATALDGVYELDA